MRVVQNIQMQMGEVDVSKVKFDLKSRDDIPRVLRGLQHLYSITALREQIFGLLQANIAPKVDKGNGRPGMTLWRILVCGVVRLDLNIDYDRLHELVNQHNTLREMLGHGAFDEGRYEIQTLKDNVSLLTPQLLEQINQVVISGGHALVKKNASEALRGRCDSFVVETHVHDPTDINLLYDAMRKVIQLSARWCESHGLSDWRQHAYNVRHMKRIMRAAQNAKRSRAKAPEQQEKREALIVKAHTEYLDVAQHYLSKSKDTLAELKKRGTSPIEVAGWLEIECFMKHAERQIAQTLRRVIRKESIPHAEKVFSLFQPHTEWISKGKAGVPVELGVKVCILEDQYRFILHHQVMQGTTDDQAAVSMVKEAQERHPQLRECSFDKGFHSKGNQLELTAQLERLVLPRKGKLSQQAQALEQTEAFIKARHQHSAVESAINALEVHGLNKCRDHGIEGFKRYVALAVVARNIHRTGDLLWQRECKHERRKRKCKDRDTALKKTA